MPHSSRPAPEAEARPTLSRRQKNILEDLKFALDALRPFEKRFHLLPPEEQQRVLTLYRRYQKVMVQACSAGLADHHLVREWVLNRRLLGEWDLLRQARRGLEKGVKRPIPLKDLELRETIARHQQPPEPGGRRRSLEAVRLLLIKQGIIPNMSRQVFSKLVARLNAVEGTVTVAKGRRKTVYHFEATERIEMTETTPGKTTMRLRKAPTRRHPKNR